MVARLGFPHVGNTGWSRVGGNMKKAILCIAASAIAMAAQPAIAADYLYMTGSSNPWGSTAEDQAMTIAFGAGNWDKANGFSSSAFSSGYSFIYFDGGDGISSQFDDFVDANQAAIESFVTAGGRIMLNAARWSNPVLSTGFGTTLTNDGYSFDGALTAAGIAAGLGANGAGTAWTGNYFAHDQVSGAATCYVSSAVGCHFGSTGGLFVGGQTSPDFQSAGGLQLRANELAFAANGALNGAVPEPATWALLILGFGALGATMRRTKREVRVSFA